jgi:hypothetical protein
MLHTRIAAVVFSAAQVVGGVVGGIVQGPPSPAQQAQPQKPPSATAVIRGRITASDSGQPARRAQIRLTRIATGPTSGPPPMMTATADADGNYELTALLPGRYVAVVTKSGYIDAANTGQPGNIRPPLEIAEGQVVEHVDFVLSRASVIAGRVFDEVGDPISNVQVAALRAQGSGDQQRFFPNGRQSTTDDLGSFRIFGLQPGEYIVQATWRQNMPSAAEALGRTGYAPTYFPGTTDAMAAQRFTLKANQSVSQVEMTLIPVATVRVSGSIVDSKNAVVTNGAVILMQARNDGPAMTMINASAPIRDGKFTFPSVAPGAYVLQRPPMNGPGGETAALDLNVGNDDISDLLLITSPPIKVTGRIALEPGPQPPPPKPRVMLTWVGNGPFGGGPGQSNSATDDGRFELSAPPGIYRLSVQTMGGWTVRAIHAGAADVTDELEIKPGRDITGVVVDLTSRTQTITGTVSASPEQIKDSAVIVFPTDAKKMKYSQRYVRVTRPAPDGRFAVPGLPPGDYAAIALEHYSPGPTPSADFLESVRPRATSVTLLDGETRTVDLRLNSAS